MGFMAKAKQKAQTAAQRREKERQQRQQRLAGSQGNQTQARNKRTIQRKSSQRQWLFIGGVLLLIAIIVGAFIVLSRQQSGGQTGTTQANSQVFNAVTNVDPTVLSTVGTGGVQNPLHTVKGPPPVLLGPTGKPQFLYIGAEYCPYCAAQRWGVAVALSRFGTFSKLYQTTSSSTDAYPSTPTFTFYAGHYGGSFYTSKYIDFVPVETLGNVQDASGNYTTLQTPTTEQQNLLNTYDVPPYTTQAGSIPFIDIANQYIISGASYNPQDLQSLQWQDIANKLSDPTSTVGKDILGTANYITAGICMTTHQQPGSVCNTDTIQKIEQSLSKSAVGSGGAQIAVAWQPEAVLPREEQ
jgi:thiol-disulfide isomerase/thioredoxin